MGKQIFCIKQKTDFARLCDLTLGCVMLTFSLLSVFAHYLKHLQDVSIPTFEKTHGKNFIEMSSSLRQTSFFQSNIPTI